MEENQISHMSLLTAYQRGYHVEHDDPKIFNDFLANHLLTVEERALFVQQYLKIVEDNFPAAVFADQASLGLRLQENLCPSEIESRYFKGRKDNYHATEHTHYAWAVVE